MKKLTGLLQISIAAILIYWFLFHGLGQLPFRVWDETRLINSAYEMNINHHYLVPAVDNHPDVWNCKPPLMIWAQVLFIKLFGFCEWSVRMPAALCGMLVILLTALFARYLTKDNWAGLVPVIVLTTTSGLIGSHAARFGEYDAMLTFFTTCYLLSFFMYTESTGRMRNRYLLIFFISLSLAGLTKGIAAMLFAPALLLYLLLRGQLVNTLSNKYFYIGLLLFLLFVPGYYLLREYYNPGYLQAVWDNELGGRFNTTLGGAKTPATIYFQNIRWLQFPTWYWALPTSLLLMWFASSPKIFRAAAFCWLAIIVFIAVLSISETKVPWYDLPAFPLFATLAAIVIWQLSLLCTSLPFIRRKTATVMLLIIFSVQPVYQSYNYLRQLHDDLLSDDYYSASWYFRQALQGKRNLNGTIYLSCCYNIEWRLYVKWLNDCGVHIKDFTYGEDLNLPGVPGNKDPTLMPGDKILANQPAVKNYIDKNYNYQIVEKYYSMSSYLITSVK